MVSLRISIYFTQKHRNMITIWCSTCSRNRHYVMMSTHVLPSVWKKLYPVPICTHRSLSPQLVLKKFCTHGYIYDAFGRWSAYRTLPVMWCEAKICHLSLQNRWNMGCIEVLCVRRRISICLHIKRLGGCGRYRPQACSVCLYHFYISSIILNFREADRNPLLFLRMLPEH